jgi:ABC-type Mn2+/Zn2+ transport system permease subunit
MNLMQFVGLGLVVGLVLLPAAIAALINGSEKSEAEPEFEYDYR